MLPSKYEINIARREGMNWNGTAPAYSFFCRIDAGTNCDHAKEVAAEVQRAFPAPEYHVTLHQCYEYTKPVEEFDWRVEV